MCVSRCPPSLIKMNVMQTTGKHSLVRKQAEGEKVKQQTRLLTPVHAMKLPSGSGRTEWKLNMHFASWYLLQCTKDKRLCCVFWTVVMALIRSRHKGASSVFMCGWCVRWNQSRPGCATRKVLVECTTPHCSYPPTPPRPVCPADVTERVGWWSTLIPSWESAEGESRPETQFFNPGRLLPPCSAR